MYVCVLLGKHHLKIVHSTTIKFQILFKNFCLSHVCIQESRKLKILGKHRGKQFKSLPILIIMTAILQGQSQQGLNITNEIVYDKNLLLNDSNTELHVDTTK